MPRIAYRRILPITQFISYVLLIWYGCLYRPTWQSQLEHWLNPQSRVSDGWDPTWIDGAPSLAEEVALGVNAPAILAAGLLLVPFDSLFHNGASKELAAHVLGAFSVLPLWYFIGRRLERRTAMCRAPLVFKVSTLILLAAASLVALLIAASLVIRSDEFVVARLLILVWAVGSIWASSRSIRLWRIEAPVL